MSFFEGIYKWFSDRKREIGAWFSQLSVSFSNRLHKKDREGLIQILRDKDQTIKDGATYTELKRQLFEWEEKEKIKRILREKNQTIEENATYEQLEKQLYELKAEPELDLKQAIYRTYPKVTIEEGISYDNLVKLKGSLDYEESHKQERIALKQKLEQAGFTIDADVKYDDVKTQYDDLEFYKQMEVANNIVRSVSNENYAPISDDLKLIYELAHYIPDNDKNDLLCASVRFLSRKMKLKKPTNEKFAGFPLLGKHSIKDLLLPIVTKLLLDYGESPYDIEPKFDGLFERLKMIIQPNKPKQISKSRIKFQKIGEPRLAELSYQVGIDDPYVKCPESPEVFRLRKFPDKNTMKQEALKDAKRNWFGTALVKKKEVSSDLLDKKLKGLETYSQHSVTSIAATVNNYLLYKHGVNPIDYGFQNKVIPGSPPAFEVNLFYRCHIVMKGGDLLATGEIKPLVLSFGVDSNGYSEHPTIIFDKQSKLFSGFPAFLKQQKKQEQKIKAFIGSMKNAEDIVRFLQNDPDIKMYIDKTHNQRNVDDLEGGINKMLMSDESLDSIKAYAAEEIQKFCIPDMQLKHTQQLSTQVSLSSLSSIFSKQPSPEHLSPKQPSKNIEKKRSRH